MKGGAGDAADGFFPEEVIVEDKPRSRRPINLGPDAPDILESADGEMGGADGLQMGYDPNGMMPIDQQAGFGYDGQGAPMGGSLHALSPVGAQADASFSVNLNSPNAMSYQQQQQPY